MSHGKEAEINKLMCTKTSIDDEEILSEIKKLNERTILQKLASIYDPFGIISPTTIIGKIIYCDICDSKISWEKTLPDCSVKKEKWEKKQQN